MNEPIRLAPDEDIYRDYLVAMVSREPVYTVTEAHSCSIRHLFNVRRRVEAKQKYSLGEHCRKDIYEYRYAPMMKLKHKPEILEKIITDMYIRSGFTVPEIVEYSGIDKEMAQNILLLRCG